MPDPNTITPKPALDSAETPEDVATLYSWANLHGAKYRDFSASRAQAREEARLRAEEAAAAERRRQEEEAERRRQEEAQIAARQAAEAAEAARQAEAERLAEIARQAEVERQAVLSAQEAQRQAAQQRGWQSQPTEIYSAGYNPVPSMTAPGITESFEYHPPQAAAEPAPGAIHEHSDFASPDFASPDFASFESAQHRAAAQTPSAHQPPTQFLPERERPASPAPSSAFVERAPAQATDFSRPGSPAPGASPWSVEPWGVERTNPAPAPVSVFASPAEPVRYPEARPSYPRPSYPSAPAIEETYMPSPWLNPAMHNPEMHEDREQTVRPAWLAPELPSARPAPPQTAPATPPRPVPMYAQSLSQGAYAPQPPAAQAPHAIAVPPNPDRPSPDRLNPQQTPSAPIPSPSAPPSYVVPGEDAHTGGGGRVASRWFALKSVFDPQSAPAENAPAAPPARVPTLAVFSLAGGVGKTSLIAALGRALSSRGERVLLVDTAPYGLLPFFFGARDQRPGQLRTFNPPGASLEAPIQLVTLDPETPPADAHSADPNPPQNPSPSQPSDRNPDRNPDRNQDWLVPEVLRLSRTANRILIDLPTASGSTTRRILRLNPTILVPVAPDMNSVVSVGAIESFFRHNGNIGGKQIMPYYVLNQFDYSLPLHLDVRELLREQIGDRLLPFALRRSPAVSEALAEGMTVIDYAPSAVLAEDYASLAGWVRSLSAPATQTYRGVRWSER
jgi:cellulose biosynthesis protein BcsQ